MRPFTFAVSLALATIDIPAFSADLSASDVTACAALYDSTARLECFDGITAAAGISPRLAPIASEGIGSWDISEKTNPLDDSRTVVLGLIADTGQNRWGQQTALMARCQSKKVEVYIVWGDYLADNTVLTLRIDSAPAYRERWNKSSDSLATFSPGAKDLLGELVDAKTLVAQITPYNESPRTAVFDLTGLSNAVVPLWEACGVSNTPNP